MVCLERDLQKITSKEYDLIVVGGGIFGVCAAWDATLRGLSVVIVEKGDFASATSANHFKMAHGGIRYLQHGDIYRIRESSRERSALLRIAPHLVKPLPIVIPTYGHGIKGREFLRLGMLIYDLITIDRNKGIGKERQIPWGESIPPEKVLELFPGLKSDGLTGAGVFCDGQIYNPPRLALSFLRSAAQKGADAANYAEVVDLLKDGNRITGVEIRDALTGESIKIKGRTVLNTAGPWAHRLLRASLGLKLESSPTFSRDLAFVVNRAPTNDCALACTTASGDTDAVMDRGGRHLFIVPWRNYTLVGVWHAVFDNSPEEITVSKEEMQGFIDEVNAAYPGFSCSLKDVTMINTGLTLFGEEARQESSAMSFGKRSRLIDHAKEHQLDGLVTLIGVRATTARGMAAEALNLITRKLGRGASSSATEKLPIYGGDVGDFEDFFRQAQRKWGGALGQEQLRVLVHNYGSEFVQVLRYGKNDSSLLDAFANSTVLKAEVVHAVREEMAQKLTDVVFRRTDLGTGGHPGEAALEDCAKIMAAEKGWSDERLHSELQEVGAVFGRYLKGLSRG